MSAYVIAEIEVDDPAGYEEYRSLAAASVTRHGGRYVARGGQTEIFEGHGQGELPSSSSGAWRPPRPGITPTTTNRRCPSGCGRPEAG
jgi:hypothetical protein